MAKGFQNLKVWKEAHNLVIDVYPVVNDFPKDEMYGLTSQIKRASVSIAANIAESTGRYHFAEKIHLLYYARGSIEELKSHLLISKDLEFINDVVLEKLDNQITHIAAMINRFINYLKEQISK